MKVIDFYSIHEILDKWQQSRRPEAKMGVLPVLQDLVYKDTAMKISQLRFI